MEAVCAAVRQWRTPGTGGEGRLLIEANDATRTIRIFVLKVNEEEAELVWGILGDILRKWGNRA